MNTVTLKIVFDNVCIKKTLSHPMHYLMLNRKVDNVLAEIISCDTESQPSFIICDILYYNHSDVGETPDGMSEICENVANGLSYHENIWTTIKIMIADLEILLSYPRFIKNARFVSFV